MTRHYFSGTTVCALLLVAAATVHAAPETRQLGQYSGFEGIEEVLGEAMVAAIKDVRGKNGEQHDFTGRELEVGLAISKMIKTLTHDSGYQHEMNDALVKPPTAAPLRPAMALTQGAASRTSTRASSA